MADPYAAEIATRFFDLSLAMMLSVNVDGTEANVLFSICEVVRYV